MCIICADMSGQFRRSDFLPEDLALDRGVSASQRANQDGSLAFLDLDGRGGTASNGKPSFTPVDAGAQITRANQSWATGLGQAATVTYAYRSNAPATMPSDTTGFSRFTQVQIEATELMLLAWSDVARITFQRQGAGTSGEGAYSDTATMLFGNYADGQNGAAAFAYLPGGMPGSTATASNAGNVWVNSTLPYNATPTYLAYGYQVLLHEIGHGIGLSHPADYNAGPGVSITYSAHATYYEDSRQYTVMSYFSESNTGGSFFGRYSSAPLLDDIAAAQRLYGANMTTRTGDTVYGFNSTADRIWYDATQGGSNQDVIFAVWDAGGTDTLDFSGYSQNGLIDLRQGHFSSVGRMTGNVSIAMGAVIENAIGGSGADTLIGNSANNRLRGNTGNDSIDGGAGSDTAVYSGLQANYTVTAGTETINGVSYRIVTVTGPEGTDVLRNVEFIAFSDATIPAPTAAAGFVVEGDATADNITGTAFADWIYGADGADSIDGGDGDDRINGGRGNDTLNGGLGTDTVDYAGATAGVTVNLTAGTATGGSGSDTLSNFENIGGTTYSDTLTGNGSANVINGAGGVDTLNGEGGNDTLIAGVGTMVGAADVVKPSSQANLSIGTSVNIDANFDKIDDPGVMNATTIPHAVIRGTSSGGGQEYYAFTVTAGQACTFDIASATFDTTLRIFDAAGNQLAVNDDDEGSTNSFLTHTFATGGTYYVAVGAYSSGTGSTVVSGPPPFGASYVLNVSVPGHSFVEAVGVGSTLNGGEGDDLLYGNVSNDTINGGNGSDTAVFSGNRSAWTITDNGNGSFTLTNGSQTDTLTGVEFAQFADQTVSLTGAPVGPTPGNDSLQGTTGDDNIDGLAGNDTIDGREGNDVLTGGLGQDTLTGGAGNDRFVFRSAAESPNDAGRDIVTDFVSGTDSLDFTQAGSDRVTIQRSGADTIVYFGSAPGGVYQGSVQLTGALAQGYDLLVANANLTLLGDGAANTLTGHVGDDIIQGGNGNDIINGAAGADVLTGGAGNDRFDISSVSHSTLAARDVITDFTTGSDRLNLGSLVNAGYTDITLTRTGGSTFVYFALAGQAAAGVVEAVGAVNGGDLALAGQTLNLTFNGSTAADVMTGAGGADTLNGGEGDDTLRGGLGNDSIDGGLGSDTAVFAGNRSAYTITNNGNGTFTITGTDGADTLTGVEYAQFADETVALAPGVITGTSNGETINGTSDDDTIYGLAGDDVLNGLAGDDILIGGLGADQLNGGEGSDTASYAGAAARVVIRLWANTAAGGEAVGDVLTGIENLVGSAFNDQLSGDAGDNIIEGGAGPDTMGGREGFDTLSYASSSARVIVNLGNETASGGDAAGDIFSSFEGVIGSAFNDILNGGNGNQTIEGGLGNDTLNGGNGYDTLSYRLATNGVTVNLATGLATGMGNDTISNFERVIGSSFDDSLSGDGLDNVLIGGAGADALAGGGGFDTADYSGSGAGVSVNLAAGTAFGGDAQGDTLASIEALIGSAFADTLIGNGVDNLFVGGAGADAIDGAGGIDTASYAGSSAAVQISLGAGTAAGGDAAGDVLTNIENLIGSSYDDVLIGDSADNVLIGGAGADVLDGEGGSDWVSYATSTKVTVNLTTGVGARGDATGDIISDVENVLGSAFSDLIYGSDVANHLIGGAGNDTLQGRAGDDILEGGVGNDKLNGGSGADLFVFAGASGTDVIQDFAVADGDVIQLDSTIFSDFADVMSATTDDGLGNTVISRGGVSITLTGVLKAQLSADDFAFAAPAPVLPEAKDGGALTLPGLVNDDPMILPVDFGPMTKPAVDGFVMPQPMDGGFDPLILPTGLESKALADEAPVICPPGDSDISTVADMDAAEAALAAFSGGREQHRILLEPRGVDWIV